MNRGSFGGLAIASVIRAIEERTADATRTVRSVTVQIPMPITKGPTEITVETLRTGSNVSTTRAQLVQDGAVKLHAVAVLAATRRGVGPTAWLDLVPPEAPSWRTIEPAKVGPSETFAAPEFTQHFEYRVVQGVPMSGGAAVSIGWIR